MKFKVSGEVRHFPEKYYKQLEGPIPPEDFESNGCSFSPDYIRDYQIWPACHRHDYHYSPANPLTGTWAGRREADVFLRRNLENCLKLQGAGRFTRWRVGYVYWGRVRIWGAKAFNFVGIEKPLSFWHRVSEGWGFFKDKRK